MVVTNPEHALTFGSLNLIGTDAELAANGYRFEALGDDMTFGNPVSIQQKVISWLQDGAILALRGYDNRADMLIRVRIVGADSNKLAIGEAALMGEVGKPNALVWTPPDGEGEPCVFSVVMSSLEHNLSDLGELRIERIYTLRIQAEPFVRSQDLVSVTVDAPTGTQTITSIDDCASDAGWAGTCSPAQVSGKPTLTTGDDGSKVFLHAAGTFPVPHRSLVNLILTRTGLSDSITTTPYIRVVVTAGATGTLSVAYSFKVNGVAVPVAVQEGNVYWLDTTGLGLGATITSLAVNGAFSNIGSGAFATVQLNVLDVSRSDFLGTESTNRQLGRTLAVAGSARTQGSLAIEDAADSLGQVLVYTTPTVAGQVQPNLRALLSSGNTETGDSTTISGFTSNLAELHTFDIPVSSLSPGGHLLLVRVTDTAVLDRTFTWAAKARQGSNSLPDPQTGETTVTIPEDVWSIVTVAKLNLPPRKLGPDGVVRIEVTASTGTTFDEAWLFNVETGRLSVFDAGSDTAAPGGPANRAWLDAPTVASPVPALYLGTEADRSDAYHVANEAQSFVVHEFVPPSMNVFTVTSNSIASSVTLSHFPRHHTHVVAS